MGDGCTKHFEQETGFFDACHGDSYALDWYFLMTSFCSLWSDHYLIEHLHLGFDFG